MSVCAGDKLSGKKGWLGVAGERGPANCAGSGGIFRRYAGSGWGDVCVLFLRLRFFFFFRDGSRNRLCYRLCEKCFTGFLSKLRCVRASVAT